jgi:hypothetical protein
MVFVRGKSEQSNPKGFSYPEDKALLSFQAHHHPSFHVSAVTDISHLLKMAGTLPLYPHPS